MTSTPHITQPSALRVRAVLEEAGATHLMIHIAPAPPLTPSPVMTHGKLHPLIPTEAPILWTRLTSLHLPSGLTPQHILAKSSFDAPSTQDEIRKALNRDYDVYAAGPTVDAQYTIYSN